MSHGYIDYTIQQYFASVLHHLKNHQGVVLPFLVSSTNTISAPTVTPDDTYKREGVGSGLGSRQKLAVSPRVVVEAQAPGSGVLHTQLGTGTGRDNVLDRGRIDKAHL